MNNGWSYLDRITPTSAGQTILAYYTQRYCHSSEAVWRDRILAGDVRLNDRAVPPETRLQAGQVLRYDRPPWEEPVVPLTFGVLYEDEDLCVVEKPAGLPVLPGGGFLQHTLLWQLQQRQLQQRHPHWDSQHQPVPIHRLGRGTSGLVLVARSPLAKRALTQQMRDRQIEKIYRALALGLPTVEHLTLTTPIGPQAHPVLGTVYAASDRGFAAHSEAWVLERRQQAVEPWGETLFAVQIFTGRPHQIRIHLAAAGLPLVGDPLYGVGGQLLVPQTVGPGEAVPVPGDCGYWLHAHCLRFVHPRTGAPLAIESPPPTRLQAC